MSLKVIDISDYQTNQTAAMDSADGVIVKATQGTSFVAKTCDAKYQIAKKAGKLRGVYHYAAGGNPVSEANYFYNNIKGYVRDAILILDWEKGQNAAWGNTQWCFQFAKRIHDLTGVWIMLYTGSDGVKQNAALVPYSPLWFAGYPDLRASWSVPKFIYNIGPFKVVTAWQFTDSEGQLDRSIFYLTPDQWHAIANPSKAAAKPASKPAAKPTISKKETVAKTASVAKSWKDSVGDTWYAEKGHFKLTQNINLRWGAKSSSTLIALLNKGAVIEYDAYSIHDGYVWLRQPRGDKFGYLVSGEYSGGKRTSTWGTFSK
ncbi:GH25 family lysozyme [Loigolactobacillus bifermentans]|nr:GH25 family lysozyme [Loigolactobacillus bifermentans]